MPLPDAIVAVVLSGPLVLMIRRGPSGHDPGYWAPPSGKVEPGERQEAAVIREVKEEVGVTIRPVRKVWGKHLSGRDPYTALVVGGRGGPRSQA